jgi:hypothetical protein
MRSKPGSQPDQEFETSQVFTFGTGKIGVVTELNFEAHGDFTVLSAEHMLGQLLSDCTNLRDAKHSEPVAPKTLKRYKIHSDRQR